MARPIQRHCSPCSEKSNSTRVICGRSSPLSLRPTSRTRAIRARAFSSRASRRRNPASQRPASNSGSPISSIPQTLKFVRRELQPYLENRRSSEEEAFLASPEAQDDKAQKSGHFLLDSLKIQDVAQPKACRLSAGGP